MNKYRIYFVHVSGYKMYKDMYAITLSVALKNFETDFVDIYKSIYSIKEV